LIKGRDDLQDRADALVDVWKRRLGLDPWEIIVKFCNMEDIEAGGEANVAVSQSLRRGIIKILWPDEYNRYETYNDDFPQDIEQTIIHELLHIPIMSFADPEKGSLEDVAVENFVEQTAKLLVSLQREDRAGMVR